MGVEQKIITVCVIIITICFGILVYMNRESLLLLVDSLRDYLNEAFRNTQLTEDELIKCLNSLKELRHTLIK